MFFPFPMGGASQYGATLALRTYTVSPDEDVLVNIVGRKTGFLGWLLAMMGLDPITTLQVTRQHVTFQETGFFGVTYKTLPLTMVASTECGYKKSAGDLVWGILFILAALFFAAAGAGGGFVLFLILGGYQLFRYWISRTISVGIVTAGSTFFGVRFKRGLIENVSVDLELAVQTAQLINSNVILAQGKSGQ